MPKLWLLRRGNFYVYSGEMELDKLHRFATMDYDTASIKGQIPSSPTALEKLWKMMQQEIEEQGGIVNTLLMKDEYGNINIPAVIIVYALPTFTCIGVCLIFMKGESHVEAVDNSKEEKKKKQ